MSKAGLVAIATPSTQFVAYYGSAPIGRANRPPPPGPRGGVAKYVAGIGGIVAAEFEEVESGRHNDRPQLAAALVIAKLDRLARNARFLLHVAEGTGEAGVVFCDLPSVPPGPVGKFRLTQMAAVAELEAGLISQRTKAALAAAKARGTKLGNPQLRAGMPALGLLRSCPTLKRRAGPGRAPWPSLRKP